MLRLRYWVPLCMLAAAVGCGKDDSSSTTDEATQVQSSLSQDFAGLTAGSEDPMFGEDGTYEDLGEAGEDPAETPPSDDPVETDVAAETDAATGAIEDDGVLDPAGSTQPVVYALLVTWGRQILDLGAKDPVVWNPTVRTDCGKLGVRRLVAMELGEGVVRPRPSASEVSFHSATLPSFDGTVLALVVSEADRACIEDPAKKLRVESEALTARGITVEIPFDGKLADKLLVYPLGDGNNVTLLAHRIEPEKNGCRKGDLMGRWLRVADSTGVVRPDLGRFYGRVLGPFGELRGYIKGVYGVPAEGKLAGHHVFFGKYINRAGTFEGLLGGLYGGVPDNPNTPFDESRGGVFGGAWYVRPSLEASAITGLLGGVYMKGPDAAADSGFFRGRYASVQCLKKPGDDSATPLVNGQ